MKTASQPVDQVALGLTSEVRARRQAGVVLCHVDGKHMLVPAMTKEVDLDCLFLLNPTGVFVWEHLDGRQRVWELGNALSKAFAIDFETATADVASFLVQLLDQSLIALAEPHWY